MFRCQAVLWAMLAWTMIFSYTMLTYAGVGHIYQTIPIVALFFIIVILNSLLCHVAHRTKTLLLFSTWCAFLLLAILLRTWSIITDWHLNLIVSIFTLIASVVWLVAGHVEDVTESGLYWHVWSLLSIFSVLCAFNNDSQTAIIIYAVNTGILCITHVLYIRHIIITQTPGSARCKHLFRTVSCLVIILTLLTGTLFYKTNQIDEKEWQEWVIVTEVVLFVMLLIDIILGFAQKRINGEYSSVESDDYDFDINELI